MEHPLLKPYRAVLDRLTLCIKRYDKHPNTGNRVMILNILDHLKEFNISIRLNALNDTILANNLVFATITLFDQCISGFENQREFVNEIENVRKHLHFQGPNKEQVYRPLKQDPVTNLENYDPTLWNKDGFLLFQKMVKDYVKNSTAKIKYINIWYYLKRDSDKSVVFNFTQDEYKNYIIKNHNIKIKKFAKSGYSYEDKELKILHDIEENFL